MVRNISYNKKELKEEILLEVGKGFSLFKRLRLGGNGSQRYVIKEASKELEKLANLDNKTNFCNIELRERGIILRFRSRLETYAWIVPYYLLSVFKNEDHFSIFAGAEFVRLTPAHNASLNTRFLTKLLEMKSKQQLETIPGN